MLTELPSNNTRVQPLGTKRIRLDKASPSNEASDKAIPPMRGNTALEAAMAAATTYIKTLHKMLQPFLTNLIWQVLKDTSAYHYKSEKLKEMIATQSSQQKESWNLFRIALMFMSWMGKTKHVAQSRWVALITCASLSLRALKPTLLVTSDMAWSFIPMVWQIAGMYSRVAIISLSFSLL